MAWDHLAINKPHLVYIILGGFTSMFMLCSTFIKERMYIGEATVATICGVIFGPHAANLINPLTWGNTDQITIEFSRIVLVVQCFAVGVELPKYYMEKHWRSVVLLLIPVMTCGWLITSVVIWWMIPPLNWLESLCVAACVTATDPVLASSVVGKGKFAKRVPKHLRDLLSAESGCNDGMAFPFIYLALYIIHYKEKPPEVAFHWIVVSILYECVFGAFYGFMVGYIGRHGIKYAEKHDLVDRESFLVFYFVLALFCAGSGSILGTDDLLVGFAAGVGFSNDGWFTQKTEESHVSNVIDLLLNLAYFVYLGTIIPWGQYNAPELGTTPWKLVVIALFVILFRRIPIMMALKPIIPDIETWREALFAGHFGPIGVGAIFVAILARADLESGSATPLAQLPSPDDPHYTLIALIWPIVTFLVIASIIVHGSSIAVFTLGKHINTLTLTMSYTNASEDGPSWMSRLPRIASQSKSMSKASLASDSEFDITSGIQVPPGTLPPLGVPGNFLRRMKEEESGSRANSLASRRRKKHKSWELHPGGPISESAIRPVRRQETTQSGTTSSTLTPEQGEQVDEREKIERENSIGYVQDDAEMRSKNERRDQHMSDAERHPERTETYVEGDKIITENEDGEVLTVQKTPSKRETQDGKDAVGTQGANLSQTETGHAYSNIRKKFGSWMHRDETEDGAGGSRRRHKSPERTRGPALVYQFGNTVIVEDADGEVVKKYDIPTQKEIKPKEGSNAEEPSASEAVRQGLVRMGTWSGGRKSSVATDPSKVQGGLNRIPGEDTLRSWAGFGPKKDDETGKKTKEEEKLADDDRRIRFTIGGAGRRLTKDDFLEEIKKLDPKLRWGVMESSDAPEKLKEMARKDASDDSPGSNRLIGTQRASGSRLDPIRSSSIEIDDEGSPRGRPGSSRRRLAKIETQPSEEGAGEETPAERRRREHVLKGVKENSTENSRANSMSRSTSYSADEDWPTRDTPADRRRKEAHARFGGDGSLSSPAAETPAERRRREAALGLADGVAESDSEDDNTERVPKPKTETARKGIRFAAEPVRGRK